MLFILYNGRMKKIVSFSELKGILPLISKKYKVVAGGCFDILHYGHFTFLSNAKKEGDCLIVILESDKFIKKHKNRQPIHSQFQRAEILAALEFVDLVVKIPLFASDREYS